jgi:hypothetical protein
MVLWCKMCDALLGLRMPFDDWTTDRSGLCASCAAKEFGLTDLKTEKPEDRKTAAPQKEGLDQDG